jgi:hypothetical protein
VNKRIRLLAEQATTRIEPTATSGEGWIFDKEKFAELIVRECAGRVDWILAEGGGTQGDLIREHFGVKP